MKTLRLISSPENNKNSRRYAMAIKRIARDVGVKIIEIEANTQSDVNDAILMCSLHGGKYLKLEPSNFNLYTPDAPLNNAENFQTARYIVDDIVSKFDPKVDKILLLGKGALVGKPVLSGLMDAGFAVCVVGSKPSINDAFIEGFTVIINATHEDAKPVHAVCVNALYDVSGNFCYMVNSYIQEGGFKSAREIGTATTKLMLSEL